MSVSSLTCSLSFLPTGYKVEVSKTSSVGGNNFARVAHKTQAFIYVYQFIIKDAGEQSDEDVYRARSRRVLNTETAVLQELKV